MRDFFNVETQILHERKFTVLDCGCVCFLTQTVQVIDSALKRASGKVRYGVYGGIWGRGGLSLDRQEGRCWAGMVDHASPGGARFRSIVINR